METHAASRKRSDDFNIMDRSGEELEPQCQAPDDALGRTNNEELVVDRLIGRGLTEEVADADEHLPLRAAEVEEGQRLMDLHVEARVDRRRLWSRGRRA